MIEPGDRILLIGEGREFFVKAGQSTLSTDKGRARSGIARRGYGRGRPDHA